MPLLHLALSLGLLAAAVYYFSSWREKQQTRRMRTPGQHNSHGSMNPSPGDNPIAVIIPALHEGAILPATINRLFLTSNPKSRPTVVVVYAGSQVDQRSLGITTAHATLHLVWYPGPPSRGAQLNFGVAHAITVAPETSLLLFLHADTLLPPAWDDVIRSTILPSSSAPLSHPPAMGTFTLSLPPPISPALRLMLWGAGWRARWGGMPYGDQGYFLTRRTFDAVGGFPLVPIMEDVELLRRVARVGRVAVVDEAVETSVRRWKQKGVFWNTILNQVLIAAWMCGLSHETIYRIYYGGRSTA